MHYCSVMVIISEHETTTDNTTDNPHRAPFLATYWGQDTNNWLNGDNDGDTYTDIYLQLIPRALDLQVSQLNSESVLWTDFCFESPY